MSKKHTLWFVAIVLAGITIFAFGYWYAVSRSQGDMQVFCTQEAKQCPDGSYVGRTGAKCEFAACPEESGGENRGILPYASGIRGVVTRGPLCPVVREGESCPDALYATDVFVYHAGSDRVFAATQSGADGTFSVSLPPGDYIVNAKNDGISNICSPVSVSVGPDEMESVDISCDTGIR